MRIASNADRNNRMRKHLYLLHDLACLCAALIAALYLRHGIPLIQEGQPEDLYLLLLATLGAGLLVLPLMRTHTSIWRFTSTSDVVDILIAVALVVLISNSGLFLISRLHMVPRSVPPMHWALAVVMMCGSRVLVRQLWVAGRGDRNQPVAKQHVIVVGACQAAELYLQFIRRILQHPIMVEGFVDSDAALTHRVFQKHRILGTPDNLGTIIEQFHVHGIQITHLVLAQPLESLTTDEQQQLQALEASGAVELVHFAKQMAPQAQLRPPIPATHYPYVSIPQPGFYPYTKRLLDFTAATLLAIAFAPMMLLISLLVAIDIGFPVIFWQQRPGRYGKPFRLVKFRTMRSSRRRLDEPRHSHKSTDGTRTSGLGKILRRFRLDELPQLFHIIVGTMAFVGPRPLLPDDQPTDGAVRLSVRPGVTGWAQIHGGDALTPEEKLTLDRWYIEHQSLWLDIRILFRTLLVVLKVDKSRLHTIAHAKPS